MPDTLIDEWVPIRKHGKSLLFSMLFGLAISGVLFVATPKEWESFGQIQIGQVGVPFVGGSSGTGGVSVMPIESVQVAFERITSPSFVEMVCRDVGRLDLIPQLLPKRFGGRGQIDVRQVPNSDLIIVRVRAMSPELSQKVGEAIVAALVKEHGRVLREIQELRLPPPTVEPNIGKWTSPTERIQLSLSQVEPFTRPTRATGATVTLAEPVFPRPMYFAALGVLIGFLVLGVSIVVDRFREAKQATDGAFASRSKS